MVDMQATPDLLRERVEQRLAAGGDVSEADRAVLEAQLAASEPLTAGERLRTLEVNVANPQSVQKLPVLIERLAARLSAS